MPLLSFSGLLSQDGDIEMKDVSPESSDRVIDIPIKFDFDFELDGPNLTLGVEADLSTDFDDVDLRSPRSPRSPTYKGGSAGSNGDATPFDIDKVFGFPLLSPSIDLTTLASHPSAYLNHSHKKENLKPLPPAPKSPLLWIWTCHLCRSRYPLGATRRCLVDGHLYCSGDTSAASQRNVKRKRRGQACSSEFDYVGWQEWGAWKKEVLGTKRQRLSGVAGGSMKTRSGHRDCEACEYPSQCRYERINKIPEVVTSITKKANNGGEENPKTISSSQVAKKGSKAGKPDTLRMDTAENADPKNKIKRTTNNATGSQVAESANAESTSAAMQVERADCEVLTPTPQSPDTIDYNKLFPVSGGSDISDRTPRHMSLQPDADNVLVRQKHSGRSKSMSAAGEVVYSGPVKAMGLKKLTRSKDRRQSADSAVRGDTRQSRISDFFGRTK